MPPPVPSSKLKPAFYRSISSTPAATAAGTKPPPPPPIRRSSSITSQDSLSTFRTTSSLAMTGNYDEDVTPHGSMENVSISPSQETRLSLEAMVAKASNVASNLIHLEQNNGSSSSALRRSTSMSTKSAVDQQMMPPPPPANMGGQQLTQPRQLFDRETFLRRSLTLTSKADRANLINTLTERISQRMQNQNNVTVIPVGGGSNSVAAPSNGNAISPEGEKYGFGVKFKQSSNQYFDMSASYPAPQGSAPGPKRMTVENQKFIDNLSSKLLSSPNEQSHKAELKNTNGEMNGLHRQPQTETHYI